MIIEWHVSIENGIQSHIRATTSHSHASLRTVSIAWRRHYTSWLVECTYTVSNFILDSSSLAMLTLIQSDDSL